MNVFKETLPTYLESLYNTEDSIIHSDTGRTDELTGVCQAGQLEEHSSANILKGNTKMDTRDLQLSKEDLEFGFTTSQALNHLSKAATVKPSPNARESAPCSGHRQTRDEVWVKTGDHSIEATGITSSLLIDDLSTEIGPATFFHTMNNEIHIPDNQIEFNVEQQAIRLGSYLTVASDCGYGLRSGILHWGNILPFHKAPLEVSDARHDLHLHIGEGHKLGECDPKWEECYFIGGVPNSEVIGHVLNPKLGLNNPRALTRLARWFLPRLSYFSTETLYAKLLFYSMVLDEFTFSNQTPQAVAYDSSDAVVNVIDISNANLDPEVLDNLIWRQELVLMDGSEVFMTSPTDWQILRWVASAGCRINAAAKNQAPHSCYVHWPSIPVNVLARTEGPPAPTEALVTAQQLITFAFCLASRRLEWTSFNRGLYLAMDLIGMRMVGDEQGFWPVRSCLSPMSPTIPRVVDYNFMFRLLMRFPPPDLVSKQEVEEYLRMSEARYRVRAFTLYTAVLSIATSTLMYDYNLTAQDFIAWNYSDGNCSSLLSSTLDELTTAYKPTNRNSEPTLIRQPKKAFKLWLGCGVVDNLYRCINWSRASHFGDIYKDLPPSRAPRFYSALCIDNWLLQRPIEWGLVNLKPKVNFRYEITNHGQEDRRGWYASRGSRTYNELVSSSKPMKLAVYGAQGINAISQILRLPVSDVPKIMHRSAVWPQNTVGGITCEKPVLDTDGEHTYIPEIFAFEPLSIRSFDYSTQEVRSPVIVGQATLNYHMLELLRSCGGQENDVVGLVLDRMKSYLFEGLDLDFGGLSC